MHVLFQLLSGLYSNFPIHSSVTLGPAGSSGTIMHRPAVVDQLVLFRRLRLVPFVDQAYEGAHFFLGLAGVSHALAENEDRYGHGNEQLL